MDINKEVEHHWALNGDTIKFKTLDSASYDMVRGSLTRYAYGRLKDWMDAEDAVQEAYYRLLRFPPQGEGHNFGGLFKLALDRTIAEIGSKNTIRNSVLEEENDIEEDNSIDSHESTNINPDQAHDMVELTSMIMDMSDILPAKKKHIVRLAMIFNYSYREIAGITKTDEEKVRNTLKAFRQKIRENPDYEDLRI